MTILEFIIFLFISTVGSLALVSVLLESDKEVLGKIKDSIAHGLSKNLFKTLFLYVLIPFLIFFTGCVVIVFLTYSFL